MIEYLSLLSNIFKLELVAALVATITFIKYRKTINFEASDYLLRFLWIGVFCEFIGHYPRYIDHIGIDKSDFFINNQKLLKNYWIFNIYSIVIYSIIVIYFKKQLKNKIFKKILTYSVYIFLITTIINISVTDIFFKAFSQYTDFTGLLIIICAISFYYYELLNSNDILKVNSSLPFYISFTLLLYYLSMTPIFLSSVFYTKEEVVFIKYYKSILSFGNYFLYGMFIFAFLRCYWFNKSPNTKSSLSSTL